MLTSLSSLPISSAGAPHCINPARSQGPRDAADTVHRNQPLRPRARQRRGLEENQQSTMKCLEQNLAFKNLKFFCCWVFVLAEHGL